VGEWRPHAGNPVKSFVGFVIQHMQNCLLTDDCIASRSVSQDLRIVNKALLVEVCCKYLASALFTTSFRALVPKALLVPNDAPVIITLFTQRHDVINVKQKKMLDKYSEQ